MEKEQNGKFLICECYCRDLWTWPSQKENANAHFFHEDLAMIEFLKYDSNAEMHSPTGEECVCSPMFCSQHKLEKWQLLFYKQEILDLKTDFPPLLHCKCWVNFHGNAYMFYLI